MADRPDRRGSLPRNKATADPTTDSPDIPLVGARVAPVAGHDEQSPHADTGEGVSERKQSFQKRLDEKVEQSRAEHPDGSAPPLDRLTQDLDPNKDL
jgi:hypothetical protein